MFRVWNTRPRVRSTARPCRGTALSPKSIVESEGQVYEYLSWGEKLIDDEPGGDPARGSLASPADEHLKEPLGDGWRGGDLCPTESLLERLYEALELPGEFEDYHRALSQVRFVLKARMLAEPGVLDALESLAWLDVRLVLGRRGAFTRDPEPGHAAFLSIAGARISYPVNL